MRNPSFIFIALILLLFNRCIDPLELETDSDAQRLVVDGMITDEPGPYSVRLSRSKQYDAYHDSWSVVEAGARVIISDNTGNQETLTETAQGLYQTSPDGIRGQVGNIYTLQITTKGGQQYTSAPETMRPVSPIDSLYFEVRPYFELNEENVQVTRYAVHVLLDAEDPASEKNYYMWRWKGTFRVSTQPWDYTEKVGGVRIPMPKDCCETCWVTANTNSINVLDDRLNNGTNLKRHLVTRIPVTEQAFGFKYHLDVKQYSLSEAAFNYWRILKSQIERGGSIQDPPPANVIGNMSSISNPNERVLGFFGASAATSKAFFVNRDELGVPVGLYVMPDDCRVLSNSTTEQPVFW